MDVASGPICTDHRSNAPSSRRVLNCSGIHEAILLKTSAMVRGIEGNEMSTPRASQKKQPASASRSANNQKSILGFFQKKTTDSPSPAPSDTTPARESSAPKFSKTLVTKSVPTLTPQPSSDPAQPSSPIQQERVANSGKNKENGSHASTASLNSVADNVLSEVAGLASSPSRKVASSHLLPNAMLT